MYLLALALNLRWYQHMLLPVEEDKRDLLLSRVLSRIISWLYKKFPHFWKSASKRFFIKLIFVQDDETALIVDKGEPEKEDASTITLAIATTFWRSKSPCAIKIRCTSLSNRRIHNSLKISLSVSEFSSMERKCRKNAGGFQSTPSTSLKGLLMRCFFKTERL